jgi:hypothetical protein
MENNTTERHIGDDIDTGATLAETRTCIPTKTFSYPFEGHHQTLYTTSLTSSLLDRRHRYLPEIGTLHIAKPRSSPREAHRPPHCTRIWTVELRLPTHVGPNANATFRLVSTHTRNGPRTKSRTSTRETRSLGTPVHFVGARGNPVLTTRGPIIEHWLLITEPLLSTLHELLEHTEPWPPTNTHTRSNVAAGPHQPPLAEPPPYQGSLSSINGGLSAIPTIQEAPDK